MRLLAALTCAASLASGCGPGNERTDGACKATLAPGDLVITEVFADYKAITGGSGADTGKEWFEIYNASSATIDLEGMTITHSRPDGTKANTHVLGAATIAPGQYFTLGNAAQEFVPAYVDYGYGADLGDMFNSDGGKLALSCGDSEVDNAGYDEITEGHARELSKATPPEYTANDGQTNWCEATAAEFEAANFGTPGAASDCQPVVVGQCNDGGTMRAAVAPGPGDLVLTEVMPSPDKASDTTAEWFEAKVITDVDLNGVGVDRVGETTKPDVIASTDCVRVRAGSYVVFAKSTTDTLNGGLPLAAIAGTFKFSMITGTAAAPGDISILAGDTVVDAISWTTSSTGKSLQLDPTRIDPTANDDQANFCDATEAYGLGDLGTPGLANTACGVIVDPPTGDMCDDGGTMRAIVKPTMGQLVISELLINPEKAPPPQNPNDPLPVDAQREWFEVANTAATSFDLNGLLVGRVGMSSTAVQSAQCIAVAPGGFALFARSNVPALNGGLPAVDVTFSFSLVDSNGAIEIADDTTVLDTASWKSVSSGLTRQLDPAHLTTDENDDALGDKLFFCAGQMMYGDNTNKGTPRAANTTCP